MIIQVSQEFHDIVIPPQLLDLQGFRYCELQVIDDLPVRIRGKHSNGDEIHGRVVHGIWRETVRLDFKKGEHRAKDSQRRTYPFVEVMTGQLLIKRCGFYVLTGGESRDVLGSQILKSIVDLP